MRHTSNIMYQDNQLILLEKFVDIYVHHKLYIFDNYINLKFRSISIGHWYTYN